MVTSATKDRVLGGPAQIPVCAVRMQEARPPAPARGISAAVPSSLAKPHPQRQSDKLHAPQAVSETPSDWSGNGSRKASAPPKPARQLIPRPRFKSDPPP